MGLNDKRIHELRQATTVNSTDYFVIDQCNGPARCATVEQVATAVGSALSHFACYIGAAPPDDTFAGQFWLEP